MQESAAGVKLSKPRCVYCLPETWERMRWRARKSRMPLSRFGWLCCRRAAGEGVGEAPEPSGHALVLATAVRRRLCEDALSVARSGRFVVRAPGGAEAVVSVGEAAAILRLAEGGSLP